MKPLPMRPMRSFGLVMSEVLVDDEIGVEPPGEEVKHVLDRRHSHPLCGLLCQSCDMRREENLFEGEERVMLRGRLVVEYVQTCGGHAPFCQRGGERDLIDDSATCGVGEDNAGLHPRELPGRQN